MYIWRQIQNGAPFIVRPLGPNEPEEIERRAYGRQICPCDGSWYIKTTCPCNNCSSFMCKMQAGRNALECDGSTLAWYFGECDLPFNYPVPLHSIEMKRKSITSAGEQGVISADEAVHAIKGSYISSILHEIIPPFTGVASCRAWLDESPITLQGASNFEIINNVPRFAGDNTMDKTDKTGSCESEILLTSSSAPPQLLTAGIWNLDLEVIMTAQGDLEVMDGTQETYMCRTAIICWDLPSSAAALGSLFAVPQADADGCFIIGNSGIQYYLEDPFSDYTLGPYNTKEEAQYVLVEWGDFIGAVAGSCACPNGCGDGVVILPDGFQGASGEWEDMMSFAGPEEAGWGCDLFPFVFDVTEPENTGNCEYRLRIENYKTGQTTYAPIGSGTYPPCTSVTIQGKYSGEEPDIGDGFPSGEAYPLGEPPPICVLADEESEYYERPYEYAHEPYSAPEGIPSNSAELADYIAWMGGQ